MTTNPTDTQLQGETLQPPRWTVCYNIVSPESDTWVGRGWEFFNDEKDAKVCYRRHQRLGNVPTKRPFYSPVDLEHLGVVDQKRLGRRAAVAGPRGDAVLPEWSECQSMFADGTATALSEFIRAYEPVQSTNPDDKAADEWRQALIAVLNDAATSSRTPAESEQFDLDPLEFWCDLAEVLGHPRPQKVNPASLVAEVNERLAVAPAERTGAEGETAFFWCPACQQKRLGQVEEVTIMCLTCKNVCDVPPGLEINPHPSDSARRAAEEIADRWFRSDLPEQAKAQSSTRIMLRMLAEEVVSKYFAAAAPADNDAEPGLVCVCPITPSERCQIHAALVTKGDR